MKMRSVAPMRLAKYGCMAASAFLCVLGVLFILQPELSSSILMTLLGAGMAGFGITKIIGYFSKDLFRLAFQYDLETGILLLLLGSTVLIYPTDAKSFLVTALGILTVMDSLFKLRISQDARAFGIPQWRAVRVVSILTGIVGLSLMLHPWHGTRVLTVLLGLALIAEGCLNLFVLISMVRISKNQYPDIIDTDYEIIEGD